VTLEEAPFMAIILELTRRFDVGVVGVLQETGADDPPYTYKVRFWGKGVSMLGLCAYLTYEANQIVRDHETLDSEA